MSTGFGAGMRHYRIGILEVVQSEKTFGATTSYRRAGKVFAAYKFNKGAKALREGALDAYNTVMFQLNFSSNISITRDSLIEFRGKNKEKADELLKKLGIAHLKNASFSALSGGQQQRIAIARMFLKNPPIIFLDEPTASLDAIATEQIKASIDAIKKDRTVIIISHSISQIIDSDVIYALKEGRVEQSGHPDELYQRGGVYKDIVDASARSLNIDKLAQTLDVNGDGTLFN